MSALYGITRAIRRAREMYEFLGITQLEMLLFVDGHPGCNHNDIMSALDLPRSSTSRGVNKLESVGLLANHVNPENKAYRCVYLTPKGMSLMKAFKDAIH